MKFDFKNGKTYFELLFSPSFEELHCSTIAHMNHMEHMFQDLSFYCTKKVPKNHNHFFQLRHGGGTNFLVLAHTLIYVQYKYVHNTIINHSLSRIFTWGSLHKRVPKAEKWDCHTTVHVSVFFLDFFAPAVRLITACLWFVSICFWTWQKYDTA